MSRDVAVSSADRPLAAAVILVEVDWTTSAISGKAPRLSVALGFYFSFIIIASNQRGKCASGPRICPLAVGKNPRYLHLPRW
jgi:hypothetical protein